MEQCNCVQIQQGLVCIVKLTWIAYWGRLGGSAELELSAQHSAVRPFVSGALPHLRLKITFLQVLYIVYSHPTCHKSVHLVTRWRHCIQLKPYCAITHTHARPLTRRLDPACILTDFAICTCTTRISDAPNTGIVIPRYGKLPYYIP